MYIDRKKELAYLCLCQRELVAAIIDIETCDCDYKDTVYIDSNAMYMLGRRKSRWVIINAIDNKVVGWVARGRGDFARLMVKWLTLNGYYTI